MSHDPWGGGSDDDPKLRLKELAAMEQRDRAAFNLHWMRLRRYRTFQSFQPLIFAFLCVLFAMWVAFGK